MVESLPVLRTGEAVVTGQAAKLPIRCRVTLPPAGERPESEDPLVATAWAKEKSACDYNRVVAAWRSQDPKWKPKKKGS